MTPMQPNPVKEALELAVGYITDAMAEAQAEYELNAPYPLRAKQFEARLESINADLEKVQRALTQPAIPEGMVLLKEDILALLPDSETPSTIHKPDSCLPAIHKDAVKRALELMERHWDGYSTAKEIITNAALLNKEIAE